MLCCKDCKYGNTRDKDDRCLTEKDKLILMEYCEECSQFDKYRDEWIAANFTYK